MRRVISFPETVKSESGMTLMDAILLVLIIAIVAGPLGRLAVSNLNASSQSMIIGEIIAYAEGSMEEVISVVRNTGVSTILSGYNFDNFHVPDKISRSLTVTQTDYEGIPYVKVDVTVSNSGYSTTLRTLFRGP